MSSPLAGSHPRARRRVRAAVAAALLALLAMPGLARASTQTLADPAGDSPAGIDGLTDLRGVSWSPTATGARLDLTFARSQATSQGVLTTGALRGDVLLDTTGDGTADYDLRYGRAAGATTLDFSLAPSGGAGAPTCADVSQNATPLGSVATTVRGDEESAAVAVPAAALGQARAFRWAAFAFSLRDKGKPRGYDYAPDAANPSPGNTDPGDYTCGGGAGVAVDLAHAARFDPGAAAFTFFPPSPQVGQAVSFDASAKGGGTSPAWDLDGDGAFDDATGPHAATTFNSTGPHTVSLRTLGAAGAYDVSTQTVVVASNGPVAAGHVDGTPHAGSPVVISAAGSHAGAGHEVVAHWWDLNGDGHFETNTGKRDTAVMMVGSHDRTVGLRVEDDLGRVADTTIDVNRLTGVPRGCRTEVQILRLHVIAGCITVDRGIYHIKPGRESDPAVGRVVGMYDMSLDGITLSTQNPNAELQINPDARELSTHEGFHTTWLNAPGGPLTLFAIPPNFDVRLGSRNAGDASTIFNLFSITLGDCPVDQPRALCQRLPGDFPLTGAAGVSVDTASDSGLLRLEVSLNNPLHVTGGVTLRADLFAGITIDSLHFGIEDATLGPVNLERLNFVYEPPGGGTPMHTGELWRADVFVSVRPQIGFGGILRFVDGEFNYGHGSLDVHPGILIYPGVFLNHFEGGFGHNHAGDWIIQGGIGISLVNTLDVIAQQTYEHQASTGLDHLGIHGQINFLATKLADAYTDWWSDGYWDFGGGIDYSYPNPNDSTFRIQANLGGWIEDEGHDVYRWQVETSGKFSVASVVSIQGSGFINQFFAAGCGSATIVIDIGYGCGYLQLSNHDAHFLGGDPNSVNPYRVTPTRTHQSHFPDPNADSSALRGRAAGPLVDARTFTLPGRPRAVNLEVDGRAGAPDVVLGDPHGRLYRTRGGAATKGRGFVALRLDRLSQTTFTIAHPVSGKWIVYPAPGSPAIRRVLVSPALPRLRVAVRVTGKGHRRTLSWTARGLAGRRLSLAERGREVSHTLVTTTRAHGSVRVDLQNGPAGRRRVEALVTARGLAAPARVVAHFRAPGPGRPGRPGAIALRRRGGSLVVTWKRAPGADGYRVRVTGNDGRRELHLVARGRRKVTVRNLLLGRARLVVTVAAWRTSYSLTGRARQARYPAPKPKKRTGQKHHRPKPKRKHRRG